MAGNSGFDGHEDRLAVLRAHRQTVDAIAARHGLRNLRVAPTGRGLADLAAGRNYDDLAAFDEDIARELGVRLDVHPAQVLDQPGHSRDFDEAISVWDQ